MSTYLKYLFSGNFNAAVPRLGLLKGQLVSEDLQLLDQVALVPLRWQLLVLHGAFAG
jgi:hypothetical protein